MVSDLDTQGIIDGFWGRTLPIEEWTHMAHLIVGLHTAIQHDLDTSISLLRDGIRQYNISVGTPNTDTGGYHETITIFFAHAMQAYVSQFEPSVKFEQMADRLKSSVLVDPKFMLSYYSKDRLFSVEARQGYLEPDCQPLDHLRSADFWISQVQRG